MKEQILNILTGANKQLDKSNQSQKRVIGDKKDVVTQGDIEIGAYIINSFLKSDFNITIESEEQQGVQMNCEDRRGAILYCNR